MNAHPQRTAIRHLVEDYAHMRIHAAELLEAILHLDPHYFSHHGVEFKRTMSEVFMRRVHLSPSNRVRAWQEFYEAFYDRLTAPKLEVDS